MSPAVGGVLLPNSPYFGGTDNPGDNTGVASSYPTLTAGESAPNPATASPAFAKPPGAAVALGGGTDTVLPAGVAAVPLTSGGLEYGTPGPGEVGSEGVGPAGGTTFDPASGAQRESGQDEVSGAEATTPDLAPGQFMVPNP